MDKNEALTLLKLAEVFYPEDDDDGKLINLNDVFGWAVADCEKVEDNELVEVAGLFKSYGWCGILYWVCQKRNNLNTTKHSEFCDINRFVEFVKNEEALIKREPNCDKRAYLKYSYTLE